MGLDAVFELHFDPEISADAPIAAVKYAVKRVPNTYIGHLYSPERGVVRFCTGLRYFGMTAVRPGFLYRGPWDAFREFGDMFYELVENDLIDKVIYTHDGPTADADEIDWSHRDTLELYDGMWNTTCAPGRKVGT
jgi:hypothetical protein